MELWVRSQDKERLMKINVLEYKEYNDNHVINGYGTNECDNYDLGLYKTKERALEVLDEIEERICLLNTMSLVNDTNSLISFKKAIGEDKTTGLCYPYQMPKE